MREHDHANAAHEHDDTLPAATDGPLEVAAVGEAEVALQQPGQARPAAVQGDIIRVPARHNARLARVVRRVNRDRELHTLWACANVNGMTRLGMSDHGAVHVQIVANVALRLLRALVEAGKVPDVVRHHGLTVDDAEVVVVVASLFHDIGMVISRPEHERYSLIVAAPKIKELLDGIYDIEPRTILWSEILHAILVHTEGYHPITWEAGIVRVADALDMTKGRSRIPYEAGAINIHSLSAAAIERVTITRGEAKPVRIDIAMNNSAGIFQVDELLRGKVMESGLEADLEIVATIAEEAERKLLTVFRL